MANELVLLKLILDEIPALIFILDADGYITFANKTAIELSGYALEPTQRLNIRELLDRSSFKMLVTERGSLDQGQSPQLKRYHLITKQGTIIDLEAKAVRINRPGEEPIFLGVAFDIRQRLQVEAERALLQEEIVKLQKMDIIGHLVRELIHDSNNILSGLIGRLNILAKKSITDLKNECQGQSEGIMTFVREIEDTINQVLALADQISSMNRRLLNFARQEEPSKEIMDIRVVVEESLALCLAALKRKSISVSYNYQQDLPDIIANAGEIQRVFINILFNAIDAIPVGIITGKIEIGLRSGFKDSLSLEKVPDNFLIVDITDNGQGMSEETKAKIFEPLFTTKKKDLGTGLGLSISASIIKKQNGWIECQSKEGEGTTFTIYLPVSPPKQ